MLLHDVGEDYWSISYYFFYCINLFPCERGLLVVFFLMHLWLDMGEDYLLILFFFASNLAPWWRWLLIDNGVVIPLMSTLWHDMGEDYWSTFFQLYSFLHDVKTIYRWVPRHTYDCTDEQALVHGWLSVHAWSMCCSAQNRSLDIQSNHSKQH
eukprot:SAG25_NODE_6982_length_514_cov_0.739759_1_plen_152_part_10